MAQSGETLIVSTSGRAGGEPDDPGAIAAHRQAASVNWGRAKWRLPADVAEGYMWRGVASWAPQRCRAAETVWTCRLRQWAWRSCTPRTRNLSELVKDVFGDLTEDILQVLHMLVGARHARRCGTSGPKSCQGASWRPGSVVESRLSSPSSRTSRS